MKKFGAISMLTGRFLNTLTLKLTMGLFGKKHTAESKDELGEAQFKKAESIVLVPTKLGKINSKIDKFMYRLIGVKVVKGSGILLEGESDDLDLFNEFFGNQNIRFTVEETKPSGVVQITDKTIIKVKERIASEDDVDENKIIEMAGKPDLKNKLLVKSFKDIFNYYKLRGFIQKFKSPARTIYLIDDFYFEKK